MSTPHRGGPMGHGAHNLGMTLPTSKAQDFRKTLRRMGGRLRPERFWIGLVLALAAVSVSFSVLGPKLLGDATNIIFGGIVGTAASGDADPSELTSTVTVTDGIDYNALAQVIALVTVVYFLASVFAWIQYHLMAGVTQRTMFRLREAVDHKLGRLPLSYFDRQSRGDLLSRVTNDIDNISTTLQQTLTQAISSLMTVIGVLAIMIWISPLLALISVLTVPLSFAVTVAIAKRSQGQFAKQWRRTGELNGHVEEMITGHEVVQLYGLREQALATFDRTNEQMYEASFRAQFISGIIQPAMMFISNLGYVAIAVVGGLQVATGQISLGSVQAFIQYSRQFTMPITQLASITNLLQSGIASAERVFEVLDAQEESPDDPHHARTRSNHHGVDFVDVSFRYTPDKPLIDDLNISVSPGQTVAIVGPTGAGKTTIVNLLMRFYEVDSGAILFDGVDIRSLSRDDVRRRFGMVLQDTWLFGGTIAANIAYGARDAQVRSCERMGEIVAAAKAARADHWIRTLPDGYETELDDGSSNISEGEKQLLTIARAFLSDPPMLILDEATSSVDTRTEVLIQQAMGELMRGRTSFIIAHRLSTIQDADMILVLDEGRVVETGTHTSLLAARGFYHDMFMSQFAESFDEAADRRVLEG